MKFKLIAAAGIIILSLCAVLIRFYILSGTKTVSGYDEMYACGYVPYVDYFLNIDMDGRVLYITSTVNDNLPVIEGLKFNRFILGGYLETDNDEAFNTIAMLVKLFEKYGLDEKVINKIDVANLDDIHLYTNNVDVAFGSHKDADKKIRTLKEILANLHVAENIKGLLDIRVISRQYIFTVLT